MIEAVDGMNGQDYNRQGTDIIDLSKMGRGETMAGFDNRPYDIDDVLMRQREQEIRMKNSLRNRQNTNRSNKDPQICRICLSEEEANN